MSDKLSNLDKGFALASLGVYVFPADRETRAPKIEEGFYGGTIDFEQIATWFGGQFSDKNTVVAVWAGASDLLTLDIDKGKKNGKDGFASLDGASLSPGSDTHHYQTASGGEHVIYASTNADLAPGADVSVGGVKLEGVDVRAGGSYFVWWGDEVPESRTAFSNDVPAWITEAATPDASTFSGEGFSGTVDEWLESIPDDVLPSSNVRYLMERIPDKDFGHPDMIELAWEIVRLGSERETGIRMALNALKDAWLRKPYDTPLYRRDFDTALRGAINKAGRVQYPVPAITAVRDAFKEADAAGVSDDLKAIERKVSETGTEIDFARARKEMFKIAAAGDMNASAALGIVTNSKSFINSKVSLESAWFGDGEPSFHDLAEQLAAVAAAELSASEEALEKEIALVKKISRLSADADSFSFLTPGEQKIADEYDWYGRDYLDYVKSKLKHFNKPYHVGSLWAAISAIASPWGKVPLPGAKPTDCNLYVSVLGESTSGKTESWAFGTAQIDAYYGLEDGPIIGDIGKLSALALHRALILRDGSSSLVYGDEIQSFFQGVQGSQWQTGILGDISSHYGGDVSPKLTLNDKEISGKRAKTMLTTYLTGIADQTLDAVSIHQWTNGFFYRFLWNFGEPRKPTDYTVTFESSTASYDEQFKKWAEEFKKQAAIQKMKWGEGRKVDWNEKARIRMEAFLKQIDEVTKADPLYDDVFVAANLRFATSIMKCATLVALLEGSEKVELAHLLVALSFAGPWHRSMVLAVSETSKDPFAREVEKFLVWVKRNAIRQVGKPAVIQRSAVMRAFRPNEVAERLLRQSTEEGWLIRAGDTYQLTEGE